MRKKRGEKTKKKMKMTGEDYVGGRAVKQSRRVEPKKNHQQNGGVAAAITKKKRQRKKKGKHVTISRSPATHLRRPPVGRDVQVKRRNSHVSAKKTVFLCVCTQTTSRANYINPFDFRRKNKRNEFQFPTASHLDCWNIRHETNHFEDAIESQSSDTFTSS